MIIIRYFAIIIKSKSGPGELKKIRRVGGGWLTLSHLCDEKKN